MIRLAWRNLWHGKARLLLAVGGVALALTLILSLDAIFTGSEDRITAYIDNSAADVWVSQEGVRNLHMAASTLPEGTRRGVEAVSDVASVTPILYLTSSVALGDSDRVAYIIGLPSDAEAGQPWQMTTGGAVPVHGEAVIDRAVAEQAGLGIGDEIEILGMRPTLVGLAEGTTSITNSIAFIAYGDFARVAGRSSPSFLLVRAAPGTPVAQLAARIEETVPGVTAQTRAEFARSERQIVRDMATDILAIMNSAGFLIGLAVMGLAVYTATLSQRAEYGVLKAIGARNRHLYATVVVQALLATAAGFGLALLLTLALTASVPRLVLGLDLAIATPSLVKVAAISALIAGLSAVLPILQIAGLDPAMVFRKGSAT